MARDDGITTGDLQKPPTYIQSSPKYGHKTRNKLPRLEDTVSSTGTSPGFEAVVLEENPCVSYINPGTTAV